MVENFEDLAIYQKSCELAKQVYDITRKGEFKSDYRFVQQIRAAAGSVSDNIAEGFERQGNKEFINFLYIAKGSCGEVRSQVTRAHNVGFIDDNTFSQMFVDNMINSLKRSTVTGTRYAQPTPLNSSNPSSPLNQK